jgi:hypothetical protein
MTKLIFHNKKGNVIYGFIVFVIVMFVMSIITIMVYKSWSELKPDLLEDLTSTESETVINDTETRYIPVMDGILAFVFLGFWILCIVSAYISQEHPLLFSLLFIGVIFIIIAGIILGNFYEELFEDVELSNIGESFPITHWILTHMLVIGIIIGSSMFIFYFLGKQNG